MMRQKQTQRQKYSRERKRASPGGWSSNVSTIKQVLKVPAVTYRAASENVVSTEGAHPHKSPGTGAGSK